MCSKKPVQVPLPMAPQIAQATQLSPTFREPSLGLCRFPSCQSVVSELLLAQVSSFCGLPVVVLAPLLILLLLPLSDCAQGAQPRGQLRISASASICFWTEVGVASQVGDCRLSAVTLNPCTLPRPLGVLALCQGDGQEARESWREQGPGRLTERGRKAGSEEDTAQWSRQGRMEDPRAGSLWSVLWLWLVLYGEPWDGGKQRHRFPTHVKMLGCSILSPVCILGRLSR